MSNISSAWRRRNIESTLPALVFFTCAFLAGGYYESTYSLLAAIVWLGLAAAAALRGAPRPSAATLFLLGCSPGRCSRRSGGRPGRRCAPPRWSRCTRACRGSRALRARGDAARAARGDCPRVRAALAGRATGLAPTGGGAGSQRLAWPVTYVNGLGLVAVSGLLPRARARARAPGAPAGRGAVRSGGAAHVLAERARRRRRSARRARRRTRTDPRVAAIRGRGRARGGGRRARTARRCALRGAGTGRARRPTAPRRQRPRTHRALAHRVARGPRPSPRRRRRRQLAARVRRGDALPRRDGGTRTRSTSRRSRSSA